MQLGSTSKLPNATQPRAFNAVAESTSERTTREKTVAAMPTVVTADVTRPIVASDKNHLL